MQKIPTMFERDWDGDRSRVLDKIRPDCQWVLDGEGIATQKLDGTCCMVRDGKLYRRRELKAGEKPPLEFEEAGQDEETGKSVGWVSVGLGPEDKWHRMAFDPLLPNGTYELVGPKIQGNPEGFPAHVLISHGATHRLEDAPRGFSELRAWLEGKDIEGIVWHHPDGRLAKIKLRDFGLKRRVKQSDSVPTLRTAS